MRPRRKRPRRLLLSLSEARLPLGFHRCEVPVMSFELILPFLRPIEPLLLDDSISEIMGNPDASWCTNATGSCAKKQPFPSTRASSAPASK